MQVSRIVVICNVGFTVKYVLLQTQRMDCVEHILQQI